MSHNWSATKQRLHPQSVAEISHRSVLSGDRIRQCETSSGSRHKDTDQWRGVLTLTDPRGSNFLKTGRQGPCRLADRADVVFTDTASTGRIWVTLNMGRCATNCLGISHCLETAHPVQKNGCSSLHETFGIDKQWRCDHANKFARWQLPAMGRGESFVVGHHPLLDVFSVLTV